MAIDIHEMTGAPLRLSAGTLDAPDGPANATGDVVEIVNRILGYDVEQQAVLAEGYQVMAKDAAEWADATFSAQSETLPEE